MFKMTNLTKGLCLIMLVHFALPSFAQLGINTSGADPDASAMLDVVSTDKGVLLPRMSEVEKLAISDPADGLLVFQTDGASGFYYYDGTQWVLMGDDINASGFSNIFLNNLIIRGSECVGIDCVSNENFGFATIKLKENNTRIFFTDTSTDPGEPSNDWSIEANESDNGGMNAFFILDQDANTRPFLVEAGAGNNAFYIDNAGNTGIGLNNPMHKLHVNGNIHADGDITATGTINCASDARLKQNIQPLEQALSLIGKLQPKQYRFKSDAYPALNLPPEKQYGLIAQEVATVAPQLVKQQTQVVDGEGTAMDINTVNYIGLIPVLVKGAQEQQEMIEQQQSELAALQQELETLQSAKTELDALLKVIEGAPEQSVNSTATVSKK